ncbi:MAG: hypothetical protein JKP98_13375 [Rhodobacteraceae bacterium]|nr:hypothetical protein [Paracoccaceae bacterium]
MTPTSPPAQQTYFRALRTLPQVIIHLGHFLTHEVTMPDAADWQGGRSPAPRDEDRGRGPTSTSPRICWSMPSMTLSTWP